MCVCLLCRKFCSYRVLQWGAIWFNPFATVLFTVCCAVTVECCVWYVYGYVRNLSGPYKLLLPMYLSFSECDVVFLYFCAALLMYLFVLFVNCLVKQFAMCLGVIAVLLLNVMDMFSVVHMVTSCIFQTQTSGRQQQ